MRARWHRGGGRTAAIYSTSYWARRLGALTVTYWSHATPRRHTAWSPQEGGSGVSLDEGS